MSELTLRGRKSIRSPLNIGFGEYFFQKATDIGDKIFQIDANTEKMETYGEVKSRTARLALGLRELGLKPNDVVFVCCQNGINNIIPVLATLYLGGRISSGDPRQTADDSRYLIEQVDPKMIFIEEDSLQLIEKALESTDLRPRIIVMGESDKYLTMAKLEEPRIDEREFLPVKQSESDIAFILFSSGTTSVQKGIYISNSYVLNSGLLYVEGGNAVSGVVMHFTSLYWIIGIVATAYCMVTGSAKVVGKNISAERFLYLVNKFRITYSLSSNTFTYSLTNLPKDILNKYDTSSLVSFTIGGAVVQPAQLIKVRKILPHTKVTLGYGSSENGMISCFDINDENGINTKLSSSGSVGPDTQLKVVDLDSGKALRPNQKGEIRVKSRFSMSGYHKLDDPDIFDEDGFLKTGDFGCYDEVGYIYVLGRLKDMFKYQFFQILPESIEKVLLNHTAVKEAVVFGVPHLVDNNHPGAVVVLKPNSNVSAEELLEYCNSKVADYRKLRAGLIILDELPKTVTGKIQRRLIKDIFVKIKLRQTNNS